MMLFWAYAALLTAVALAFLVTPLLRGRGKGVAALSRAASNLTIFRDQLADLDEDLAAGTIDREQWEAARGDLQRGLIEDAGAPVNVAAAPVKRSTAVAIVLAVALPVIAVSAYLAVGSPQGLDPSKVGGEAPHGVTQAQIESMVASLAQRLKANPDDAEGWVMLARSYSALGRFGDAAGAYGQADARFTLNAQTLADYADSLAMSQGESLLGKPEALIQRALKADGNNLKALALAGTVEFEKQHFAKAAEYWRQILPLLPAGSEMENSIRASIKEAEDKQGGAPKLSKETAAAGQAAATKPATATAAIGKERLSGTITLAPALAARAAPDDTVFVLARPAQGSRMPLAAVRVKVKDLPLAFSFDDSMAMSPAAKLSDFSEVVVDARVSKSGNVMPQPGDLEGLSKPVHPGTKGMRVEIAKEIQ